MVPGLEQHWFIARDGARIGYQVRAGRGADAPAVLLANGLGGTFEAYRHVFAALPDYRVVCWDYRGLFSSTPPPDPTALTVAHQVGDAIELCDRLGIDRAVVIGWSMGVQVGLELLRAHAHRVAGLLAINGTSGRPFRTLFGLEFIEKVIPTLLKIMRGQAALVGKAADKVAGSDALIAAMQRFGLVSKTLDVAAFRDVAAGFRTLDWRIYGDLLERLNQHDATDVLSTIAVPTAIVTGDKDVLTPPATAEALARAIVGARLRVIPGGTHYTPVEYPAIIKDELYRLLARVPGWQLGPATE
ncbi:MAG: alpha/beta hydrolase [Kofleriaceae bacterium]|nr:alpha/beta hydrolase [Kofleriaceae bacterium]MBP9172527.1 alpha/beta hydrolase [Kofleriaceae bacterium]MBP9863708.1 alpha/beta hydrolase [Kofleriaceae bacterium]